MAETIETNTIIIKERIPREGYVLIWTHEVPIEEAYRDIRLQRAWGMPFPLKGYAPSIKVS